MNENQAYEIVGYLSEINDVVTSCLPLLVCVSFIIAGCLIISAFLKG